jgi:hypothetical protein
MLMHLGALIRAYHDAAATFRGLAVNGCSSLGSLLRRSVTTNSSRGTPSFGRTCRWHSSIGTPRRRGLALGTSDSLCGVGCRAAWVRLPGELAAMRDSARCAGVPCTSGTSGRVLRTPACSDRVWGRPAGGADLSGETADRGEGGPTRE